MTYFTAVAGTTYHVAIVSYLGADGDIGLSVRVPTPPANDNFAAGRSVGMPELLSGTNVDATLEAGEPDPLGDGRGHSVWYRLTMHTTQAVGIDTCGSDLDTVLGVYTGSAVGGLTEVGVDDDSCGLGSIVDFVSTPGTTYHIMVRGYDDLMGTFKLLAGGAHPSTTPPPPPPPPPPVACPPAGSPAGAVGYAGTHSGGGSVCLAVLPTFAAVASFHAFDVPGDVCTFSPRVRPLRAGGADRQPRVQHPAGRDLRIVSQRPRRAGHVPAHALELLRGELYEPGVELVGLDDRDAAVGRPREPAPPPPAPPPHHRSTAPRPSCGSAGRPSSVRCGRDASPSSRAARRSGAPRRRPRRSAARSSRRATSRSVAAPAARCRSCSRRERARGCADRCARTAGSRCASSSSPATRPATARARGGRSRSCADSVTRRTGPKRGTSQSAAR